MRVCVRETDRQIHRGRVIGCVSICSCLHASACFGFFFLYIISQIISA